MIALYALLLFVGYIWIASALSKAICRAIYARHGKWMGLASGLLCVLLAALIPVWDELITTFEHRGLCKRESGVRIYSTMGLPTSFFDGRGEPLFVRQRGGIDGALNKRGVDDKTDLYKYVRFSTKNETLFTAGMSAVYKTSLCLHNRQTGQMLSCETWVAASPGWFSRTFLSFANDAGARVIGVPLCREYMNYRERHKSIFFSDPRLGDHS